MVELQSGATSQTTFYRFGVDPQQKLGFEKYISSRTQSRVDVFLEECEGWICFFDADCLPSQKLIYDLQKKLSRLDRQVVLAGRYKNPECSTLLQRAHNFICDTWLMSDQSLSLPNQKVLGGFFAVYRDANLKRLDFSKGPVWGGEDTYMAQKFVQAGRSIQIAEDLSVDHHTSKKLTHFFRRAWIQGWNQAKYKLDVDGVKVKSRRQFWKRQLQTQPLPVRAWVGMHFLILILARESHQILRKRN